MLSESNGWIDLYAAPKFSSNGRQFLMIVPTKQDEAGKFKHLVIYDRDSKTIRPLSSGRWEVTEILGWNEATQTAYVPFVCFFYTNLVLTLCRCYVSTLCRYYLMFYFFNLTILLCYPYVSLC